MEGKTRILFWEKIKSMGIRNKLLLSLLISLLAMLIVVISIFISGTRMMIDNSRDSVSNLAIQIVENLDNKVKGVEKDSYQLYSMLNNNKLNETRKDDAAYIYKEKNSRFRNVINLSDELSSSVSSAFYENPNGVMFTYGESASEKESLLEAYKKELKSKVSTLHPYHWQVMEDQIMFVRLLVDSETLETEGYLYFFLKQEMFYFVELENQILKNENVLIVSDEEVVIQNEKNTKNSQEVLKLAGSRLDGKSLNFGRQRYMVWKMISNQSGWKVYLVISESDLLKKPFEFVKKLLVFVLFALIFLVFFSEMIMRAITKNIQILEEGMEDFEGHGKFVRLKPYAYDELGMLINRFNYTTLQIQELNENIIKEQEKKEKAEFQAVLAKINPHFLYNTLGSIKWEAHREGAGHIEDMLDDMVYLLKYSIKKTDTFITIWEEIEYAKKYLELQKMRFGDVFKVDIQVEDSVKDARILGFILQPLVENSLYHGIDMEAETGLIQIMAYEEAERLVIEVKDNGKGMDQEEIERILTEENKKNGFNSIGVHLIVIRLRNYYKNAYQFKITSMQNKGTEVRISIPYQTI